MPPRLFLFLTTVALLAVAGCDTARLSDADDAATKLPEAQQRESNAGSTSEGADGFTVYCGNCVICGAGPLYVLDGIPLGTNGNETPVASIEPEDIASIEVLKEEAATSAYGSRGAHGAVLIITK